MRNYNGIPYSAFNLPVQMLSVEAVINCTLTEFPAETLLAKDDTLVGGLLVSNGQA